MYINVALTRIEDLPVNMRVIALYTSQWRVITPACVRAGGTHIHLLERGRECQDQYSLSEEHHLCSVFVIKHPVRTPARYTPQSMCPPCTEVGGGDTCMGHTSRRAQGNKLAIPPPKDAMLPWTMLHQFTEVLVKHCLNMLGGLHHCFEVPAVSSQGDLILSFPPFSLISILYKRNSTC